MAKRPLIRRSILPCPLKDLTNGTLCDTRNPSYINLSAPFTRDPFNDLQYFTWNIAWDVWTLPNPDQEVISTDGIRVNLTPFASSTDLPHWLLIKLLIQCCMKCIFLTEIQSDHFHKSGSCVSKSITANIIHFAGSKIKISPKTKYPNEFADSLVNTRGPFFYPGLTSTQHG